MAFYASIAASAYVSSSDSVTTTVAGTYYRLAGTFTNAVLNGFAIESDKLTLKGQPSNILVAFCGSLSSDTISTEMSVGIKVNGTLRTGSVMTVDAAATTNTVAISLTDVIAMDTDDNIEIVVKSDKAGAAITTHTATTQALRIA